MYYYSELNFNYERLYSIGSDVEKTDSLLYGLEIFSFPRSIATSRYFTCPPTIMIIWTYIYKEKSIRTFPKHPTQRKLIERLLGTPFSWSLFAFVVIEGSANYSQRNNEWTSVLEVISACGCNGFGCNIICIFEGLYISYCAIDWFSRLWSIASALLMSLLKVSTLMINFHGVHSTAHSFTAT